jgi:hypothetical protein
MRYDKEAHPCKGVRDAVRRPGKKIYCQRQRNVEDFDLQGWQGLIVLAATSPGVKLP